MIPGRLFTFGCSLTKYHYPTWADILGKQWQHYENWGTQGAGNQFIFNSVIECDQRNQFTETDTVLILWSALSRYDCYQFGHWSHIHNAFPDTFGHNPYNCPTGQEIFTYASAYILHQYLKSKNVNFRSMRWNRWDHDSEVVNLYRSTYNEIEKVDFKLNRDRYPHRVCHNNDLEKRQTLLYERLAGESWPSLQEILAGDYKITDSFIQKEIDEFLVQLELENKRIEKKMAEKNGIDDHPLPSTHLAVVKKIFPDITIDPETDAWIKHIESQLLAGKPYDFQTSNPKKRL